VPHFSPQALAHLIAAITPHLPAPPRPGPKGMEIGMRVRLALAHLREGVSLRGMARIHGIAATTLRDNINPVLAAFDRLEPVLPDGTVVDDFSDVTWWCAEAGGTVIIDGTEFSVARPQDQAAQRPFYSGKKKLHTTKTIAVCDGDSNLLWATPIVAGATHDLTALRDANLPAHLAESGLDVLADSGFQGLQNEIEAIELPTRRRRKARPCRSSIDSSTRCSPRPESVSSTPSDASSNGAASPPPSNAATCTNAGFPSAGRSPRTSKRGPDHETPRRSIDAT
jgi:hypothetical protein